MVIVVGMLFMICKGVAAPESVGELRQLREEQQQASLRDYYVHEEKITELKRAAGAHERLESRSFLWQFTRDVGRLMPFIVWQLLLLAVLVVLLLRKRFLWWYLIPVGALIIIVGVQRYERAQQWVIIARDDVALHMGPGEHYPRVAQLHMLDEVLMADFHDHDGWYKVSFNGLMGWLPQGALDVQS